VTHAVGCGGKCSVDEKDHLLIGFLLEFLAHCCEFGDIRNLHVWICWYLNEENSGLQITFLSLKFVHCLFDSFLQFVFSSNVEFMLSEVSGSLDHKISELTATSIGSRGHHDISSSVFD
jgi:hypothetical protein